MTVQQLAEQLELTVFHLGGGGREVTGGYCGDLLSWVMGKAPMDCAWLTIMSHINVAAVASLTDAACVILTEGVVPDDALLQKTRTQGGNLLGTGLSTYQCAVRLAAALEN